MYDVCLWACGMCVGPSMLLWLTFLFEFIIIIQSKWLVCAADLFFFFFFFALLPIVGANFSLTITILMWYFWNLIYFYVVWFLSLIDRIFYVYIFGIHFYGHITQLTRHPLEIILLSTQNKSLYPLKQIIRFCLPPPPPPPSLLLFCQPITILIAFEALNKKIVYLVVMQ